MAAMIASAHFTLMLRVLNTNLNGKETVRYALTAITGVGRRLSGLMCKKAGVDVAKRAGELNEEEIAALVAVLQNPLQCEVPEWFLNRRKDWKDGKTTQVYSNTLSTKLRDDLEVLKKMRAHRGLRHYWGLKAVASTLAPPAVGNCVAAGEGGGGGSI
eukprot:CAMPEP_0197575050 /NCGR_PEP_ID=MMETSP1326-20131121/585_1 /TAXON_ID=1155430 /ORGANISM="Genus nov. species nov., Strain RCC2288" /LENGTH=157 /DNA_ID=CAMNT_0043137747 /DNA_START=66 /DNA_END=537 /DNA_ORIENTATION=-